MACGDAEGELAGVDALGGEGFAVEAGLESRVVRASGDEQEVLVSGHNCATNNRLPRNSRRRPAPQRDRFGVRDQFVAPGGKEDGVGGGGAVDKGGGGEVPFGVFGGGEGALQCGGFGHEALEEVGVGCAGDVDDAVDAGVDFGDADGFGEREGGFAAYADGAGLVGDEAERALAGSVRDLHFCVGGGGDGGGVGVGGEA